MPLNAGDDILLCHVFCVAGAYVLAALPKHVPDEAPGACPSLLSDDAVKVLFGDLLCETRRENKTTRPDAKSTPVIDTGVSE